MGFMREEKLKKAQAKFYRTHSKVIILYELTRLFAQ